MKFGGTSVEDASAFGRVTEIVRANESARVAVVVSAMSGVTDALLWCVRAAAGGDIVSHGLLPAALEIIERCRTDAQACCFWRTRIRPPRPCAGFTKNFFEGFLQSVGEIYRLAPTAFHTHYRRSS
jgi:aspartokinase